MPCSKPTAVPLYFWRFSVGLSCGPQKGFYMLSFMALRVRICTLHGWRVHHSTGTCTLRILTFPSSHDVSIIVLTSTYSATVANFNLIPTKSQKTYYKLNHKHSFFYFFWRNDAHMFLNICYDGHATFFECKLLRLECYVLYSNLSHNHFNLQVTDTNGYHQYPLNV